MSTTVKMRLLSLSIGLALVGLTACTSTQNQTAQTQPADTSSGDPANGNLAPVSSAPAPSENYAPAAESYPAPYAEGASYDQPVQASEPPPPLPDYSQPPCPGENYLWTPGYWGYSTTGYYWVPGAWVVAPWVGALWTPPYWGYDNGAYVWRAGYWGPHIGFYGGINYGFGYTGHGYYGAYWNHGTIEYNRTVTNINTTTIRNVYEYRVSESRGNRISYNGGRGGIEARPTSAELAVTRDPRTAAVPAQIQHAREASSNRAQYVGAGRAQPEALVVARPLATSYRAPAPRPPAAAERAAERPAPETQRPVTQAARPGYS